MCLAKLRVNSYIKMTADIKMMGVLLSNLYDFLLCKGHKIMLVTKPFALNYKKWKYLLICCIIHKGLEQYEGE